MLHFHSSVLANVNMASVVSLQSESVRSGQINVKSSVSLLLAVVNASLLLLGLGCLQIEINTVLVAVREQQRWKSELLQTLPLEFGVFSPV